LHFGVVDLVDECFCWKSRSPTTLRLCDKFLGRTKLKSTYINKYINVNVDAFKDRCVKVVSGNNSLE